MEVNKLVLAAKKIQDVLFWALMVLQVVCGVYCLFNNFYGVEISESIKMLFGYTLFFTVHLYLGLVIFTLKI